ncbi:hypothetical protein ACEK07_22980 [Alcanivoracaceae bacterium MT1]
MTLATRDFHSLFAFARATSKWAWSKDRKLTEVQPQQPARGFDPASLESQGISIEENSANYWPNSADASQAPGKAEFTFAPINSIFDTGSTSYEITNLGNIGSRSLTAAVRVANGATETLWAIFETGGTATETRLGLRDTTQNNWGGQFQYNWSTKTSSLTAPNQSDPGGTAPQFIGPITLIPEGQGPNGGEVFLIGMVGSVLSGNNALMYIYPTGSGQNTDSVYMHHAQWEVKGHITSPIITSGAAAVRGLDLCPINAMSPWFNQNQGTFLVEFRDVKNGVESALLTFSDGTVTNRFSFRKNANNGAVRLISVADGNASIPNFQTSSESLAASYDDTSVILHDGNTADERTVNAVPVGSKLYIGTRFDGQGYFANGFISKVKYIPRKLTASEMASWLQ